MMSKRVVRRGLLPQLSKAKVRRCGLPSRSNIPGDSIDNNTHYESIGKRKAMKYLREICYHRIKCSTANSLIALMWK